MARQSGNSLFNSLRGKIWISTSVLAFFICTFGLISYLVVSLIVNDPFYGVFIPFLLLAFTVLFFGWWLSNEVVNPIENVTLLAKSLERSSSSSLPRTSGSTETDQLLQTIQRNNVQMNRLVTLMDKVANGNLDVQPMEGSDRLSTSFQKLLAKVTESIHAKEELDELRDALNELKKDISGIRSGNLDVEISSEYSQTRDVAETIKYLTKNFSELITAIQSGLSTTESSVSKVEDDIESIIQRDEMRVQDMTQASIALKQVPNLISKISKDLLGSAKSARSTIEKARHGNEIAGENSNTVSSLRKQVREDVKRIQSLNEKSHDIERVAKTVEDLANRTNMIALNASIQATEMGENGHGFVLVAEEVERLAARANGTNKEISTLNKSILAEIAKVENSVETTMGEIAHLSKYAIETGNVLSEIERYIAQFLSLQESLIEYSNEHSDETEAAFSTFSDSISVTESSMETLRGSTVDLGDLSKTMRELKAAIAHFRIPETFPQESGDDAISDYSSEPNQENPPENKLYDEFASSEFSNDEFEEAQIAIGENESNTESVSNDRITASMGEEEDSIHRITASMGEEEDSIHRITASMGEEEDSIHGMMDDPDSFESLELTETEFNPPAEAIDIELNLGSELELDVVAAGDSENDFVEESASEADHSADEVLDSYDDEMFDLYRESISAEPSSEFDSGEFATDELIQEFDADSDLTNTAYTTSANESLDADELEDLLDPDNFDNRPDDGEINLAV